jgi:hypothetical protein
MLTYNSLLLTIIIEGLVKSYVVPKAMDKYKLKEGGVFYILMLLFVVFSIFEFLLLSQCINSEGVTNINSDYPLTQLALLVLIALIVNYKWVMAIYDKFNFWSTIGILSLVSFINEFNNVIITGILRVVTATECN